MFSLFLTDKYIVAHDFKYYNTFFQLSNFFSANSM